MSRLSPLRAAARTAARDALYSRPSRALARAVESGGALAGARRAIEERGHGDLLRRVASPALPRGQHYLRLTITGWRKLIGRDFRLLQNGEVVYGNRIAAPPEGTPLEYRNIIVGSDDPADFTLDIRAKHKLAIGPGAFTTPEQDSYDRRYHVERHGDLHYAVRGNTRDPSRLIVTFPGFPPRNGRVSYAVSYLKALTDAQLADTMMICFQDRYGVAGTYMLADNAGRPLHDRIAAAISAVRRRHGIAEEDVLLFGSSKGASIAARTARDLPGARQVLVVPQMSLPYYAAKPVLRHGLYRDRHLWEAEQPGELLPRALAEGRRIDWFYTDSDQDSNCSLIEFARDAPGLTKHRVDGNHAAVAKKSLPTVLSILRAFAAGEDAPTAADVPAADVADAAVAVPRAGAAAATGRAEERAPRTLTCADLRASVGADGVSFTVELAAPDLPGGLPATANVYLEGDLGGTRFRQLLTREPDPLAADDPPSADDAVSRWSTGPAQRLDPALHPAAALTRIVAFDGEARMLAGALPECRLVEDASAAESPQTSEVLPSPSAPPAPATLVCDAAEPTPYALLGAANRPWTEVLYASEEVAPEGDRGRPSDRRSDAADPRIDTADTRVDVAVVPRAEGLRADLLAAGSALLAGEERDSAPVARFVIAARGPWRDLPLMVRRAAIAARADRIRILIADDAVGSSQVEALSQIYGVEVEVLDRRSARS
ncbi:hypothetical protein ACXET9_09455 [Brachybacterium sp. DNPG3]